MARRRDYTAAMDVISTTLSGLRAAQVRLDSAAHNIANAQTEGFRRQQVRASADLAGGVRTQIDRLPTPGADLAADLVAQKQAANAFAANLPVFKAADQALGRLLDVRS